MLLCNDAVEFTGDINGFRRKRRLFLIRDKIKSAFNLMKSFLDRSRRHLFGSRRRTLSTLAAMATGLFVMVAVGILGVGFMFAWYAKDLPQPDKVVRSEGLSTVILNRSETNLYDIF